MQAGSSHTPRWAPGEWAQAAQWNVWLTSLLVAFLLSLFHFLTPSGLLGHLPNTPSASKSWCPGLLLGDSDATHSCANFPPSSTE